MASSSKANIRSISLPTRSHPTTSRIDEVLNKLKTWEILAAKPTSDSICNSLIMLGELYESTNELLNLPVTQQVLSNHQTEKCVDGLLDGSVRLLDICGNTKDAMTQRKEHLADLQSCLRRRKRDMTIQSSITKFTVFRNKMKKDGRRLIEALKKMNNEIVGSQILDLDHQLSTVIKVLQEVSAISISIFQYLLVFLSVPVLNPNQSKWSLVSKLMHRGTVVCEGQLNNANPLESVDATLCSLCKCGSGEKEKVQIAQNRLEAVEGCLEEIATGLECIFRCLIKTRTSLLNIVSN